MIKLYLSDIIFIIYVDNVPTGEVSPTKSNYLIIIIMLTNLGIVHCQ